MDKRNLPAESTKTDGQGTSRNNYSLVAQNKNASFSDCLIQQRYNELPEETKDALAQIAAEKRIEVESKLRDDWRKEQNADAAVDRFLRSAHDMSHIQSEGSNFRVQRISQDIETASGNLHMEASSKRCYVATATYQNAYHPNVVILRDFRDRYLRKHFLGRCFIYCYYKIGKYLALFPEHITFVRNASKVFLDWIVLKIVKNYYFK